MIHLMLTILFVWIRHLFPFCSTMQEVYDHIQSKIQSFRNKKEEVNKSVGIPSVNDSKSLVVLPNKRSRLESEYNTETDYKLYPKKTEILKLNDPIKVAPSLPSKNNVEISKVQMPDNKRPKGCIEMMLFGCCGRVDTCSLEHEDDDIMFATYMNCMEKMQKSKYFNRMLGANNLKTISIYLDEIN